MFLKGQPIKTYLTFYPSIKKREINAYLDSLSFRLCKVLFLTSVYRAYCELLELKFGKLKEGYLNYIIIHNNLFHFLHIYHILRYTKVSLDPNSAEFLGQNAQRKDLVSDLEASSSIKSCYQILISLLCHHKILNIVQIDSLVLSALYLSSINIK